MTAVRAWLALSLTLIALGCGERAEPRPQVVLVVDTTAPTVSQVLEDDSLSPAAAMDTLRISLLDESLAPDPEQTRELVLPDVRDWPVSFGIAGTSAVARVRLLLYRSRAQAGEVGGDASALRPLAIDRLVQIALPSSGEVQRIEVVLDLGCMGKPSSLVGTPRTCITDGVHAEATDGLLATDDDATTLAGSSPLAKVADCTTAQPEGAVCVKGGLGVLGDPAAYGLQEPETPPSWPVRAVWVSPFWIDRTEVTVGRYRALWQKGVAEEPASGPGCTWSAAGGNDSLPLNCVSQAQAVAACKVSGGSVPSEAQWERAARGGSDERRYPWGDEFPSCCTARIACVPTASCAGSCGSDTPVAVDGYSDPQSCNGVVDVSRDGVVGMAGNVSERVRGHGLPYDHSCFGEPGLVRDPVCESNEAALVLRGGSHGDSFFYATSSIRRITLSGSSGMSDNRVGFRCVYPGAP